MVKPAAPIVRVDKDGYVQPVKAGATRLTVSAAGQTASVPVTVKSVASPPVSFVRDVMPILSKAGCNAGTCHGSAKGKNGFKLSLRGYDPDYDHHALIDDIEARRFNRTDPAQSLMLLKPIGEVPHQGRAGDFAQFALLQHSEAVDQRGRCFGYRQDKARGKPGSAARPFPT